MAGDSWAVDRDVEALAVRAQTGDGAALAELLDRYQPLLRANARTLYRGNDLADSPEDVLQEAALVFIRSVADYRPERGPFGPFVKRRVLWGLFRHRRRSLRRLSTHLLDERILARLEARGILATWDDYEPNDDSRLQQALGTLTAHQRRVLDLHYRFELPIADIAGRLGLTIRAVNRIRQRAELRLRAALTAPAPPARGRRRGEKAKRRKGEKGELPAE